MILFYDTETTGFMNANKKPDHPDQAHLVQLAAQLVTLSNETIMEFSLIVNPGVPIPPRATEVHGITDDMAKEFGVSPSTAVDFFLKFYGHAEIVSAHNIAFDKQVMETAIMRRGGVFVPLRKPLYCTMEKAHNVVKAPPTARMVAAGRTGIKKPNLSECMQHFFGEDHTNAHDAMADTVACRRVYFALNPVVE